jgi:hypothetical protein
VAGRLTDGVLAELVSPWIERFRRLGNTIATFGSDEWLMVARGICIPDDEALSCIAERGEGDFTGQPTHPLITQAVSLPDEKPPVSIKTLIADCIAARQVVAKGAYSRGTARSRRNSRSRPARCEGNRSSLQRGRHELAAS